MGTFNYGTIPSLNIFGIDSYEINPEEKNFLPSIETAVSQFSTLSEKRRGNSAKRISVSLPSPGGKVEDEQVRMRYTHGVKDDLLRMSGDNFQKMTLQYHDFGMDSVDVVFDVNQPYNLLREQKSEETKSPLTRSLLDPGRKSNINMIRNSKAKDIRPISGLDIRKATLSPILPSRRISCRSTSPRQNLSSQSTSRQNSSGPRQNSAGLRQNSLEPRQNSSSYGNRQNESRSQSDISNSVSHMKRRIESEDATLSKEQFDDMCSEEFLKIDINLDDLINEGKELNNESEIQHTSPIQRKRRRKSKHHKKTNDESSYLKPITLEQYGNVTPDIHRNVYIRALQDARAKYFRRAYPGLTITQAYKFSYFDVCSKIEEHKERYRREKDFRNFVGMKRIFGDIRLDDYYNPMGRYGVNNYKVLS